MRRRPAGRAPGVPSRHRVVGSRGRRHCLCRAGVSAARRLVADWCPSARSASPAPPQVAGVVVALDSVNLTLEDSDGSLQIVPLGEIVRLERYDGRVSSVGGFRRGARRGFMIGLGTSAFIWAIALIVPECQGECAMTATEQAAVITVQLSGLTTAIGGIIGSQYRAVWTSLPIPGCPDIVQCRERPR